MTDLEPISLGEAKEWYMEHREDDWSYESRRAVEKGLTWFQEWADQNSLENLNNLTGRHLLRFKTWRQRQDIKSITLNGNLAVIKRFLKFCVDIEAVSEDIPEKVPDTEVSDDDEVRKDPPSRDEVDSILQYLEKYRYASREHVVFATIDEVGLRQGAVRGFDEGDYRPNNAALDARHRPGSDPEERGTPLKNGEDSQRNINLPDQLNELYQDFFDNPSLESTVDEDGRRPIFTATDNQGETERISVGWIRSAFYKITRPCEYGESCPVERKGPETCEGAKNRTAYMCPENFSPHRLRTRSIMDQLGDGMAYELVSDRADVSVPILKKHYDHRSEEDKRLNRRAEIAKHRPEYRPAGDIEETVTADNQTDLDNWANGYVPLLGLPLMVRSIAGSTRNRVINEFASMSAGPKNQIRVNKENTATALALYPVFVFLLAFNLSLIFQ